MDLTPIDLKKQEFRRVLRGYDPIQVKRFLDEVADAWEGLIRSQEELRQRAADLGDTIENYRRIERTLNETLLAAQRIAEDSRETSLREAEIIRREAEMDGRRAVERADGEARAMQDQIRALRLERDNLFRRLRDLVEEELLRIHALREEHADAALSVRPVEARPADEERAGEQLAAEHAREGAGRSVLPPPAGALERLQRPVGLGSAPAPRPDAAWSSANGETRHAG